MDKLTQHKKWIREILEKDISKGRYADPNIRRQLIADDEHGHYLLYHIGWLNDYKRSYGCFMHLEVAEDGKIWIQHDGTDNPIALRLVRKGVAKDDIVFGFHAPYKRAYSGFASMEYYTSLG